MKYLVTGKEMKLLDQNTSKHFMVPELVLMEQAAMHFVWKLCDIFKGKELKSGIVFCGSGNNGADGIAIARLLNERGIHTSVCLVNDLWDCDAQKSESYQVQENIYHAYNYPITNKIEEICETYDFAIDAVFGVGLSRDISGIYTDVLEKINAIRATKIAVDMPSGINADNGRILGNAVRCDHTITFSFGKIGQYIWPGCEYAGNTHVVDIGITARSWLDNKPKVCVLENSDLMNLPNRPAHSNKGTFGKLLVVAGSVNMAGAAIFAAKAAYRSGVGLAKVFTREENREIIQKNVPEALLSTYSDCFDKQKLIEDISWADAIVIGPGLGVEENAKELVECVIDNAKIPVLFDADALNIIAKDEGLLSALNDKHVITPHLGEFSRLTGKSISWIQEHLLDAAIDFTTTHNVTCVLKDFRTVVSTLEDVSYLNLSGNNGMATGGSGDALAGIIGTLLAQGMPCSDASYYGVYIHGLAGDVAKKEIGTHSMTSSDIIEGLKLVWKGIEDAK